MTYDLSQQLALFEDLDVGTSHHHAHTTPQKTSCKETAVEKTNVGRSEEARIALLQEKAGA